MTPAAWGLAVYPSHDQFVSVVRWLQFAGLLTWGAVLGYRGGALWRVIALRSRETVDHRWAAITLFAATQAGFSIKWLLFPNAWALWAALYLSNAVSAVGIVWTQGTSDQRRNRTALACHVAVFAFSLGAAAMMGARQ